MVGDAAKIYQVSKGRITAGFVVASGKLLRCAPVLRRYVNGDSIPETIKRLRRMGFKVVEVKNGSG